MTRRILTGCILFASLMTKAFAQPAQVPATPDSVSIDAPALADAIIEEAKRYLGRPYLWGGNGPERFDCTGFTKYVYAKFGYRLGRTVPAQALDGRPVEGGFENLQKGDILIFGARLNRRAQGHAAIFIERDSTGNNFTFIHAARRGVIITELKEPYYTERFLGAVRILPDFPPPIPEDTLAFQLQLPENAIVPPDTLRLGVADRRIVLFEDGTWATVSEDGTLHAAENDNPIYLYADGRWRSVPKSIVKIPSLQKEAATVPSAPAQTNTGAQYHTVRSGDSLSKIASRYHTTVKALCRLNGISQNTVLQIGKKLRVK